jgi:hypothetical protein
MSVDYSKVQLISTASSNKVWLQGSGTFTVPALPGAGDTFGVATIPHGFSSDDLIHQVSTTSDASTGYVVLPWAPGDNRQIQYACVDATNLYIYFISTDSSGLGESGFTVNYVYRLLVP